MNYTTAWGKTCDAWVLNPRGPARKRCSNSGTYQLAEVAYFCEKHMHMMVRDIEDIVESRAKEKLDDAKLDLALYKRLYGPITTADLDRLEALDELMKTSRDELPPEPTQYVYFIECEQYVKIGMSRNPESRLKALQVSGNGTFAPKLIDLTTAKIIALEDGGSKRERELHQQFESSRHTGEWFTRTPELTAYIEALVAERRAA